MTNGIVNHELYNDVFMIQIHSDFVSGGYDEKLI